MIADQLEPRRPTLATRLDRVRGAIGQYRQWRRRGSDQIVLGVRRDLDSSIRGLWGLRRPVCSLSWQEQAYHALIWGTTGSGKSKLLQSIFVQHLAAGHGVGLLVKRQLETDIGDS